MTDPDSSPPPANATSPRRWYRNRWWLAALALLAVYAAAGFLLVPYLVRHYLPEVASQQLQRQASVGEVRVNPFLLTFEARDVAFREADGESVFALGRLFVDFELESLVRRAWTFAEVRMEGAVLDLVVDAEGRLNLARIAADLPPGEAADRSDDPVPLPRLLLKQVVLDGGSVTFTDRSRPTPASTAMQSLDLQLDDISTLPGHEGPYVISASLPGGGALSWKGTIALDPIVSGGTVRIDGFAPAAVWAFLQDRLRLAEPGGELDAELSYRFAYASGEPTLTLDPIRLAVRNLALTEEGAATPILQLASIDVADARFDLASRELRVPTLALRDGRLVASVDDRGTLNWASLAGNERQADAPASAPESAHATTPWKLRLEAFTVDGVALEYSDASRASPITVAVGTSRAALAATAETGGEVAGLVVDNLEIMLARINWSETAGDPLMALDSIALRGGRLDLAKREIHLQRISIADGSLQLVREADGTVRQAAVLRPGNEGGASSREEQEDSSAAQAVEPPWRFALDRLEVSGFAVGYADAISRPALRYDLDDINVVVEGIRNDGTTPLAFDLRSNVRQGGSARVSGTVTQAGDSVEAEVELARLALEPLAPLVAKFATVDLASGDVSVTARLKYATTDGGPSLLAGGALSVDNLAVDEAASGERVLAWRTLAANDIDFSLAPDRLTIREVRLLEPGAKIVIFEDKSLNLARLVRDGPTAGEDEAQAGQTSEAATPEARAGPFPVTVERLQVENGGVDFADLSLVLPFAARVHGVRGAATGITSDPGARTSLEFEGQVGEFGQAGVNGSLAPFAPKAFTDLNVVFSNVATTSLSPYSATFAGRKIASGALDLDLQYKIENSEMLGENKVLLRDFTLGETVESPKAANLPLDLAIALLTDSQGRIDLAVPVRGNVDSPDFSYGQVVWKAVANLIVKAVSAPFRALGALFGGGAERYDAVLFEPGRGRVTPPEREKLAKLAAGLAKRPQLKLVAHGTFDPAVDGKAIRDRNLRLALARQLGVTLAPGEDPGPVAYDSAKSQRGLEEIAIERGGDGAVDAFQAAFEAAQGRPAKRVNPALALVGQASEDRAFYQALFAHLVEAAPQPERELAALAEGRAEAIVQELTGKAGLEPARITVGPVEPAEAKDRAVPARLALEVHSAGT